MPRINRQNKFTACFLSQRCTRWKYYGWWKFDSSSRLYRSSLGLPSIRHSLLFPVLRRLPRRRFEDHVLFLFSVIFFVDFGYIYFLKNFYFSNFLLYQKFAVLIKNLATQIDFLNTYMAAIPEREETLDEILQELNLHLPYVILEQMLYLATYEPEWYEEIETWFADLYHKSYSE